MLSLQATTVILALTMARDEVFWMIKHNSVSQPKSKYKINSEDYADPFLPELLFSIVQMKGMYIDICAEPRSTYIQTYIKKIVYCHLVAFFCYYRFVAKIC